MEMPWPFVLKKIISPFFMPVDVILLLLVTGLILLFRDRPKWGRTCLLLGTLFLFLMSWGPLTRRMVEPLEQTYPPLNVTGMAAKPLAGIPWIVVIGAGHTADPKLPANGQLSSVSLSRVVEGIRLHQALPHTKLLFSEGGHSNAPGGAIMAQTAEMLGVKRDRIVVDNESLDTAQQARVVKKIIGNAPCILVTSALHMPRALALFRNAGVHATPAPTDYNVKHGPQPSFWMGLHPNAEALLLAQSWCYEQVGRVWGKLTDGERLIYKETPPAKPPVKKAH